jgi:hypothetical protein
MGPISVYTNFLLVASPMDSKLGSTEVAKILKIHEGEL